MQPVDRTAGYAGGSVVSIAYEICALHSYCQHADLCSRLITTAMNTDAGYTASIPVDTFAAHVSN